MHLAARSTCNLGLVSYEEGLRVQREYEASRLAGAIGDTLLLCEHPPVYTLGTNADPAFVRDTGGVPVVQVDRGGEVTWHGPGQIVGYAICDLDARGRDLHAFLRELEQLLIDTVSRFGLTGERIDGLTGVWVGGSKIGAIGVRVRRWIASHGFALNVSCDLDPYEGIVPCGIEGCRVTSMELALGRSVDMGQVRKTLAELFGA